MRRLSSLVLVAWLAGCASTAPAPLPPVAPAPALPPAPAPPPVAVSSAPAPALGDLEFPITGSPECQRRFREGMLALHSFEYDQAHESFAASLTADARCVMGAWGDAMAYDHPIWKERDVPRARAALARVTAEDTLTAKERAYLATARALFAVEGKNEGHEAWLSAAAAMHREYPDDDEVALQHALAILSVYGYDLKHVREQMEAGAIALDVLRRRPEHPGAAHYVIHSFDSPAHAILALPAARTYARIAPAAGHALHMPSHTFVHLGMWREVVPSNERAYAASVAWETAHGNRTSKYDWHSYSWLVAARLELGQPARARKLVEEARALVLASDDDDSGGFRASYADMVADYLAQTDRWQDVEALVAPVLAPAHGEGTGTGGPVACAMHAPGGGDVRMPGALVARITAQKLRIEAAIHGGDRVSAAKGIAEMKTVRAQMKAWDKMLPPGWDARFEGLQAALMARADAASAKVGGAAARKKAVDALERLDALEAGRTVAGPAWMKTTREMLGEALLAAGRSKDALAVYERELEARPNRAQSLLGAARAAKAAGDEAKARARYASLAELWRDADADAPAVAEVRAAAGAAQVAVMSTAGAP